MKMNKAILSGRICTDIEHKKTDSDVSVCRFKIAVQRRFKNAEGNYDADFISCVAWRNQADFISKFFGKGKPIEVVGSIQTRNYEKDGNKVYVTEVNVDEAGFVIADKTSDAGHTAEESTPYDVASDVAGFEFSPVAADDDLPF